MSNVISFRATLLLLAAGLASACSSLHPYQSSAPDNMNISVDVRSGSARVDVYSADKPCDVSYQGTVDLSDKKVKIGIPANRMSYLVFSFEGGSYFTGYHTTSTAIYLTPRAGYRYEAAVSYADAMYSATIYEQDAHGARREIPRLKPACAAM